MLFRRFLRLFVLLALMVAPLGMVSNHAAIATEVTAASSGGHCAEIEGSSEAPGQGKASKSIDCMIACACVAPAQDQLAAPLISTMQLSSPVISAALGLNPAADPRPPRIF